MKIAYRNLIAETIRKAVTIDDLAEHLGISKKTIRNKVSGITQFTLEEALNIKEVLKTDLSIEELFQYS